jgi:hypothetical protein
MYLRMIVGVMGLVALVGGIALLFYGVYGLAAVLLLIALMAGSQVTRP